MEGGDDTYLCDLAEIVDNFRIAVDDFLLSIEFEIAPRFFVIVHAAGIEQAQGIADLVVGV